MSSVIVGSKALQYFGVHRKAPKDTDVWYVDNINTNGIDAIKIPHNIFNKLEIVDGYCTPDTVYTIKCSHLGWDIHWEKTKRDILWLSNFGCRIKPKLYKELTGYWKKIHGNKKFLSLSKDKRSFFNDHVKYVYDHDYLHELVSYPNKPIYTRCLKDSEEVLLDKDKVDELSHDEKVRMFTEEICTIAIERWLVNPYNAGRFTVSQAYDLALKKTIVSLTKNWGTDFLVTNLKDFYKVQGSYFTHALKTLGVQMSDLKILEEYKKSYYKEVPDSTEESFLSNICGGYMYPKGSKKWAEENGYELLEQEGGGEGGSEWCYSVFKLGGKIYKINYNYYSHQGFDFDYAEVKEVKPVKKTVVVYE